MLTILAIGTAYQALAVDGDPSPLRQWQGAISAAIHARMNPQAIAGTREGTAVIRFIVLQSGEVKDVSLARSSGIDQIDRNALATVQGRLPAAPAGVTQQSLLVSMPLNYRFRQVAADPACQWSKSMRLDQSITCPNDNKQPDNIDPKPDQTVIKNIDQSAKVNQSGDDIDKKFTSCLRRMRDGTISMLAPKTLVAAVGQLLGKCNDIADVWEASCKSHGSTEDECGIKASLVAAAILKETGQLPTR